MLSAILHYDFHRGPSAVRRDERSAETVVQAAATALGKSDAAGPVVKALEQSLITHAWQLKEMAREDWLRYEVQDGLFFAIKAELAHPTASMFESVGATANDRLVTCHGEELTESLRQFLLIPGPDGCVPKPMGVLKAYVLPIQTIPPEDRQNLVIIFCELMALVGGLLTPIPLSLLKPRTPDAKGWTIMPVLEDGMDALAVLVFTLLITVVWITICIAISVATAGWKGSMQFYDRVLDSMMVNFTVLLFGCIFPIGVFCVCHIPGI